MKSEEMELLATIYMAIKRKSTVQIPQLAEGGGHKDCGNLKLKKDEKILCWPPFSVRIPFSLVQHNNICTYFQRTYEDTFNLAQFSFSLKIHTVIAKLTS